MQAALCFYNYDPILFLKLSLFFKGSYSRQFVIERGPVFPDLGVVLQDIRPEIFGNLILVEVPAMFFIRQHGEEIVDLIVRQGPLDAEGAVQF